MDTKEIQELKSKLESDIKDLIYEFERKSLLNVENIYMDTTEVRTLNNEIIRYMNDIRVAVRF